VESKVTRQLSSDYEIEPVHGAVMAVGCRSSVSISSTKLGHVPPRFAYVVR
jgi:hypothetical protein